MPRNLFRHEIPRSAAITLSITTLLIVSLAVWHIVDPGTTGPAWPKLNGIKNAATTAFGFWQVHKKEIGEAKDLFLYFLAVAVGLPLVVGVLACLVSEVARRPLMIDSFAVPKEFIACG